MTQPASQAPRPNPPCGPDSGDGDCLGRDIIRLHTDRKDREPDIEGDETPPVTDNSASTSEVARLEEFRRASGKDKGGKGITPDF